ncbi:MAG: hypothetical protein WAV31_05400 [Candidatus Moraniibacteriota bacterium]
MSTESCGCGGAPACQITEGDEVFDVKKFVAEKMKKMRALSPAKRGRKGKEKIKKK